MNGNLKGPEADSRTLFLIMLEAMTIRMLVVEGVLQLRRKPLSTTTAVSFQIAKAWNIQDQIRAPIPESCCKRR